MSSELPDIPAFRSPTILRQEDLWNQYLEEMEAAIYAKETGTPRGPKTGFRDVDRMFGGYMAPGLYIMHGMPGAGKSALSAQIATSCGCPSIYVTAEMSAKEMLRRHVARTTNTRKRLLLEGHFPREEETAMLRFALDGAPDWTIIDGMNGPVHHDYIADEVRWLRLEKGVDHVMVIIDSLHVWAKSLAADAVDASKAGEIDILNNGITAAMQLSRTENIVVLLLAHRNRESRSGGLSAVRGTSMAEYLADVILDLSLDNDETKNDLQRIVKLTAPKNRFGQTGAEAKLMFDTEYQNFTTVMNAHSF